ncbi:MAG: AraC family transcriptional regulator [Lachnospiraceae bacterium]|jgi:YesN/AraC family two-component response regulator|nr:AraC family transcriptional regulator [Lachnospiraceae bacterium]
MKCNVFPCESFSFPVDRDAVGSIRNPKQQERIADLLEDVGKRMEGRYAEKLRLESIAAEVGVSSWYLCKVIRKYCGSGFSDILTGIRIAHAEELLRNGEVKPSLVGQFVGYEETGQFIKVFHRMTGLTPRQYRDGLAIERSLALAETEGRYLCSDDTETYPGPSVL